MNQRHGHPLDILRAVQAGTVSPEQALHQLGDKLAGQQLGFAHLDHARAERCGFPEVVYCPGKTDEHLLQIVEALLARAPRVLLTRITPAQASHVIATIPQARHEPVARMLVIDETPLLQQQRVAVVTAGTADLPIAREAVVTLQTMGVAVDEIADVGVAGLHRLLGQIDRIRAARAIIVVAGMDGALPAVVAGLVDRPVLAVPTSVGYGASFEGLAPLLTMLSSCAAGVCVVNIDNGFGAAYSAALICRSQPT